MNRVLSLGAAWAVVVLLSACAQLPQPVDAGRDRVTASDESDAARRSRVRLQLASAYFERGNWEVALDEVKQSIVADPRNGAAYNLRGLVYMNLREPVLAEDSFRYALRLDPNDADVRQNFGWFLCTQKRADEALVQFDAALAQPRYQNQTRTLHSKGVCLTQAGRYKEAQNALGVAYERDPYNGLIIVSLAEALLQQNDAAQARFYIRPLNAQADRATPASLWMGYRVERQLGNDAQAQMLKDQLLSRFPQSAEAQRAQRGFLDAP